MDFTSSQILSCPTFTFAVDTAVELFWLLLVTFIVMHALLSVLGQRSILFTLKESISSCHAITYCMIRI